MSEEKSTSDKQARPKRKRSHVKIGKTVIADGDIATLAFLATVFVVGLTLCLLLGRS